MCARSSGAMPRPVSAIVTESAPSSARAQSVTIPPSGELDRVAEQVREHLRDTVRVGVDLRWIAQIQDEGDLLGVRQRLRVGHGILEEIAALHRLNVERKALRPEPLEFEEIVDQGLHPCRRSPNELHGLTQRAGALVASLR